MTEYGRIHTDGSRSGGQPIPSKDCPKCERFGDDCGEHSPSWKELAAYWKAEAERLRQPTQSDALQAGALDFGNELIFACAGLRHEPIDTEAIFSITWDGFPYDVTICAAKGQDK